MHQDLALLDKAVDIIIDIEALPDHTMPLDQHEKGAWGQENWRSIHTGDGERCRTAMCVAGWVCELDEDVMWMIRSETYMQTVRECMAATERVQTIRAQIAAAPTVSDPKLYDEFFRVGKLADELYEQIEWMEEHEDRVMTHEGTMFEARAYAQERLGLNDFEASALFSPLNTLIDIQRVRTEIFEGTFRDTV